MPQLYKAVLFDMDGLLVDSEQLYFDVMRACASAHGHSLSEDMYRSMLGTSTDATIAALKRFFGTDCEAIWQKSIVDYAQRVEAGDLRMKPGVFELLDRLEALRIPKVVASSNSGEMVSLSLKTVKIDTRFAFFVCGDDVQQGKPAPDLFLLAASKLGVSPADCLVLEDSSNGITAANAAGMDVVLVPDMLAPTRELRSRCVGVCPTLREVAARFFG